MFILIKIDNYLGFIEISNEYFSNLIGKSVSECFGVKGMVNSSAAQKIKSFISKYGKISWYVNEYSRIHIRERNIK